MGRAEKKLGQGKIQKRTGVPEAAAKHRKFRLLEKHNNETEAEYKRGREKKKRAGESWQRPKWRKRDQRIVGREGVRGSIRKCRSSGRTKERWGFLTQNEAHKKRNRISTAELVVGTSNQFRLREKEVFEGGRLTYT